MAGEQLLPWIDSGDAEGNRNSMQNFEGDGIITSWDFNFAGGYISTADVKAYIYRTASGLTDAIDPVVLTGPNTIEVIPAVPDGDFLVVYRDTPKDMPLVDYTTGAVLDEANLDKSNKQAIFVAAEMSDRFDAINASSADAITRSFEAVTIANAADDKADSALAASAAAVSTADAAQVAAAAAVATANDASDVANGIAATADAAFAAASAAVDTANAAEATANGIAGTANTALANSNAAVTTANAAAADAQDALDTIDAAVANKISKDGTIDFTAHQKLFNSSPTDLLHAASKGYVDLRTDDDTELIINPHGSIVVDRGNTTVLNSGTSVYFTEQWISAMLAPGAVSEAGYTTGFLSAVDPGNMFMRTTTAKVSLASNDNCTITQPFEGLQWRRLRYGTSAARGLWLRFRASVPSGSATLSFAVRTGSGSPRSYIQTFTVTTAQQDFAFFIPGDTSGTWPTDESLAATLVFTYAAGTSFQTSTLGAWQAGSFLAGNTQTNMLDSTSRRVDITDVSLRASRVLVPFHAIDYARERVKCLRYYRQTYLDGTSPATATNVGAVFYTMSNNTQTFQIVAQPQFDPPMRIQPVVTLYSTATGAAGMLRYSGGGGADRAGADVNTCVHGTTIRFNGTAIDPPGDVYCQYVANARI